MGVEKRPWFGWSTDYPDEGSVAVDAESEEEAMRLVREVLNADDDPEEPMECSVRPITAEDVEDFQEKLEEALVALRAKLKLSETPTQVEEATNG